MVKQRLIFALLSTIAAVGCSGGGGGGLTPEQIAALNGQVAGQPGDTGQANPQSDPITNSPPATNLNGNLTGDLWISSAPARRFNLQTGQMVDVSAGEAFPLRDGSLFVEYLEEFEIQQGSEACFFTPVDIHQINVKNSRTGAVLSSFKTEFLIEGPIRLSADAARMAMKVAAQKDCGSSTRDRVFSVYSASGAELFRGDESIQAWDWHPDGRLVLVRKTADSVYQTEIETDVGSYRFQRLIDFSSAAGVIEARGLRVSPNGIDLAFELVYERNSFLSSIAYRNASVVVSKTNEAVLSDLFGTERADGRIRVNTPVFSPLGGLILVTDNYSAGALSTFYPDHPSSDIITNIETLPVPQESVSYVVPVGTPRQPIPPARFSNTLMPIFAPSPNGGVSPVGFNPLLDQTWTPAIN